jgi:hypothetical protein
MHAVEENSEAEKGKDMPTERTEVANLFRNYN